MIKRRKTIPVKKNQTDRYKQEPPGTIATGGSFFIRLK
jgi:hypothetical protein